MTDTELVAARRGPQAFIYRIIEWSHYDADSFSVTIDLGFELVSHIKVRIAGIDTTELRERRMDFKTLAYLAKEKAQDWVEMAEVRGDVFFASLNYSGKFGRPLGDLLDSDGNRLTDFLMRERLAVPYEGQAKAMVESMHEDNIKLWSEHDDFVRVREELEAKKR